MMHVVEQKEMEVCGEKERKISCRAKVPCLSSWKRNL